MKKKSILRKGEIEILAVSTQKRSTLHSTPGARGKPWFFSTSKASPTSPQMLLEQNITQAHLSQPKNDKINFNDILLRRLDGRLSAHGLFSKLQVGKKVELFWTSNNNQGTVTSPRKRLLLWIRPQVADDDLDRRGRHGVGASRKGDVLNNFVKFWQFSCCQRRNLLPLFNL